VTATARRRLILLALVLLFLFYGVKVYRKAGDFRNFHYRTAAAFRGDPVYVDEPYAITYPPFFLVLVGPYAALPFPVAKVVWYTTQVLLLVLLLRVTAALLREQTGAIVKRRLFWFLVILAISRFLLSHFENEQFDLVVALAVLGSLLLALRGRNVAAGILLGAGAAAKLTPLLFLAYAFYKRRFRLAITGAGVFVLLLVLPDLLLAPVRDDSLLRGWHDLVIAKVAPWEGGSLGRRAARSGRPAGS